MYSKGTTLPEDFLKNEVVKKSGRCICVFDNAADALATKYELCELLLLTKSRRCNSLRISMYSI